MSGLLKRYKKVIDLLYFNDCTNVMTPSSLMEPSAITSAFNVVLLDNCDEMMLSFVTLVEYILIIVIVSIVVVTGTEQRTMMSD